MICPNCGKFNKKDYCIFCGFMSNGNYIKRTNKQDSDLEIYFGYDYDKITRNKTYLTTFLFGPLYLSYKRFFLIGFILGIIDIILFISTIYVFSMFPNIIKSFLPVFLLLLIIFRFIFWMTIDNIIYIYLIERRIKKIKKIYENKYREIIANDKKKDSILLVLLTLLSYAIIITFLVLIYKAIQ